ncbi:CHAT domain-containing protein [Mycena galopus ATCC 62051]|nr:CHAT domain-containing protein [Mycena galopus ATCC 62051]
MYNASSNRVQADSLELWVIYERILLLSSTLKTRARFLSMLGDICFKRYQVSGVVGDLNQAVCAYDDAVRDDLTNGPYLGDLGVVLMLRFEQLGDLGDLKRAVSMLEDAVQLTPEGHPDKPCWLNNLGNSLFRCFERLGKLSDLNKSVLIFKDLVQLTPDGHPDKHSRLNNLSNSLTCRFEHLGDPNEINESILMLEDAIQLIPDGHSNKPSLLTNLGSSYFHRFKQLGNLSDINKSILMSEDAVLLCPDGHHDKPTWVENLVSSLMCRFQQLGDLRDINKSILMAEDAVRLMQDNHPYKPSSLNNLGSSLFCRFQQLGDLSDINKSILILENAVKLTPNGHPHKPSFLNNLGNSLLWRFKKLGDLTDINKSILMSEDAIQLTTDSYPQKPSLLNNLGNSLLHRFERIGDLNDMNKSILMKETAVRLIPDSHPDKPSFLDNLGSSLAGRFEQLRNINDINEAIMITKTAVRMTPDSHPHKPSFLSNLGNSLLHRFKQLSNLSDINNSILISKNSVQLTPDSHPDKPSLLNNLGNSFLCRFQQLGDHDDLLQAISQYSLAAKSTTGPAYVRFNASSMWALVAQMCQHPSLLQAYTVALDLLPKLAWLGLSITDRHYHISKAGKVVRDAAAAAITACQYNQAVEWLEQGRSIIWGQLLQLRSPMDTLKHHHPDLAENLRILSNRLEGAGTRQSSLEQTNTGIQHSLQSIAKEYHSYALERDELIQKIRGLEGFERFLLPKTLSQLSSAAKGGPVIILNISETRCDALILLPGLDDEAIHVPLPHFTPKDGQAYYDSLRQLTAAGRNISCYTDRLIAHRVGDMPPEEKFKHILSELWQRVAYPVLDALAITTPSITNLQRVWWCPTGLLAFLPIHAAGLYGDNQPSGSKLSDFVISSYAPSLTFLVTAFEACSAPQPQQAFKLLTVAQPSTDGQSSLPGTLAEIKQIKQHAAGKYYIQQLKGDAATVDSVQKGMRECSWVHLACHGVQNVSNPTESALLLAGGSRLTLSSIIKLSIPHADLVFLSACQTATGDKELQEESVHLAAGMLSAGYQSVIATMWSIMDDDAPQVASDFYEHLFKASPPDSAQSAEALHLAVRKLQEKFGGKKSFMHWVPYIHIGL